ncbi:MAG: hypothetical protein ABR915_06425 [Thermoguttaceae bacterium]|jgi:hypothetical protein
MSSLDARFLLLPLMLLAGCQTEYPKPPSILRPTQMSSDAVALEIVSVRLPPQSAELCRKVWEEVDEQHFPADLRQRLARNGFRVGVVGRIPAALATAMAMKDRVPAGDEPQKLTAADLQTPPRVMPRHLEARAGQRSEVIASGIREQMPVLVRENGELCGRTYCDAQGIFAMAAFPQADGRVRLELVPEVHHGHSRPHWVGDQAMWRLESERPRRVFDNLKMSALLTPGSMAILGCLPNRPGSLGYSFFTEDSGSDSQVEEKLLLVRVCQTQHDDLVHPPPLALAP